MIANLRQQRSARTVPMGSIRNRPGAVTGIRDDAVGLTRDTKEEAALELPLLEADVLGLRQTLAEVKANREALRKEMDDLRRDLDLWRKLAEPGEPKLVAGAQKIWFCGRVSAAAQV
jgi:hypothetical protein